MSNVKGTIIETVLVYSLVYNQIISLVGSTNYSTVFLHSAFTMTLKTNHKVPQSHVQKSPTTRTSRLISAKKTKRVLSKRPTNEPTLKFRVPQIVRDAREWSGSPAFHCCLPALLDYRSSCVNALNFYLFNA